MKSKLPLLVLLVASLPLAGAAEPKPVAVNFRAVSVGLPPMEVEYSKGGALRRLPVSGELISPKQAYAGPARFDLRETPPGQRVFPVTLPAGKAPLLLVLRLGTDGQPAVSALKDGLASFPAGSTQFFNVGGLPVWVEAGGKRFPLAPGGAACLPPPKAGQRACFVQVFVDEAPDARPAFSSNWAVMPAVRTLVFVSGDPNANPPVTVQRLTEANPTR